MDTRDWKSKEYLDWRRFVMSRDKCKCKKCGYKGRNRRGLQVHHIKRYQEFPSLRYCVSNGITLCKLCHAKMKGNEEGWERWCLLLITRKSLIADIGNLLREEERKDEQEISGTEGSTGKS